MKFKSYKEALEHEMQITKSEWKALLNDPEFKSSYEIRDLSYNLFARLGGLEFAYRLLIEYEGNFE